MAARGRAEDARAATARGEAAGRPPETRAHTGRRRNEQVHAAILAAALDLLATSDGSPITIDAIARAAGVGKQTIYRWWPSKGAVLLDALLATADRVVPQPDTGTMRGDLRAVVTATFAGAQEPSTAAALRTLVRESARDTHLADLLREFTAARRKAVRDILVRGRERGELAAATDPDLIVDQFYGLFWYRFLLGHAPLDRATAEQLTDSLLR
ncbi:TetR/AcrR family transcriptional regulator [Nocardia blacklockiae]|uniref:TetR/AcrR family transcriptional regulator n=1 Tax=Nocardia blacklockiae TaxID=480036 RepID=UPI001893261D|nr:TetR/AcrR family transcriptional regulator [Nocardia blacklockiae]MBF6173297.1 TetR/AcrR family transcriptional regulator C-terminal ligand-binding domain-containing protein [Nocardia blacklockiae]